jgi:hypothetical protein
MRPCESVVEDVDGCILHVFRLHDLDVQSPSWIVTLFNGVKEIFDVVVRLLASQSQSGRGVQGLNTSIWFPVPFYVSVATVLGNVVSRDLSPQGKMRTALLSVYVWTLNALMWRREAGMPRCPNKCIKAWIPS